MPVSQNERRQVLGRREHDYQLAALMIKAAELEAHVTQLRQKVAHLEIENQILKSRLDASAHGAVVALQAKVEELDEVVRSLL